MARPMVMGGVKGGMTSLQPLSWGEARRGIERRFEPERRMKGALSGVDPRRAALGGVGPLTLVVDRLPHCLPYTLQQSLDGKWLFQEWYCLRANGW